MLSKNINAMIVSALISLFTSAVANALVITIEPDDYAVGTDLTNISPYVTLNEISPRGLPGAGTEVSRIYADANGAYGNPEYVAPTGSLTFGHHGFFGRDYGYGGFRLGFHQAVSNVSLLANSEYPGLPAEWVALDQETNVIASGAAGSNIPVGETFEISIQLENIWTVIVGGHDSIAAINSDRLRFEVDDSVSVPEPNALILLFSGLLVVALRRRFGL